MKKVLLTILFSGLCAGAFAQATNDQIASNLNLNLSEPAERTAALNREAAVLGANNPYTQKNALALGADLLYGSEIGSVGINFKFQWMLSNSFRLSPNASVWFKNDHKKSWDVNLDVQYMIRLAERWRIYPQAGLTLSHWKREASAGHDYKKDTYFGVNLGAGLEFDITQRWYIDLDFKYRIISDFDQAVIGLGFGFRF